MVIFYKKWKKYNEIQLTKIKMDLNIWKITYHLPFPVFIDNVKWHKWITPMTQASKMKASQGVSAFKLKTLITKISWKNMQHKLRNYKTITDNYIWHLILKNIDK